MKRGKFIIGVTVILIAIYIFTFNYISKTEIKVVDVTRINNVVKCIEKEFDKQQYNIPKTGELINCQGIR